MNLRDFYMKNVDPRYLEYKSAFEEFLLGRKRILDVGCGVGKFIDFDPKHIEGVDQNRESLAIAKKRGYKVKEGQVTKLPFKKAEFDGIFCGHVIEHLYPEDALKMLYEFDRILKPGGVIVIKTPLMYGRFFNDLTHIRPYPPESIMDYLMPSDQVSTQRTADRKQTKYSIVKLFYRYDFLYYPQLEPARINDSVIKMLVTGLKVISVLLFRLGIQNYFVKNGYTIVLEKLR
jgi:ubiquinone/menaquinone biosynthesis C-methylase UbiE